MACDIPITLRFDDFKIQYIEEAIGIRKRKIELNKIDYLHKLTIKYKIMEPAARRVIMIANNLFWSRRIPIKPHIKAAGKQTSESNPPRVTIGLPQPG